MPSVGETAFGHPEKPLFGREKCTLTAFLVFPSSAINTGLTRVA